MEVMYLWIITLSVVYWISKTLKRWKDLPPGPWGLPVVGYLPFLNRREPHVKLAALSKRYGSIFGLRMGSVYTVFLTDHKLIREAFSKDVFSGRAPLYLTHGIMKGKGIISAEGALWKDQRKLVTTVLKNIGVVKHNDSRDNFLRRLTSGADEFIQRVNETAGSPTNLPMLIQNVFGNVINEFVFGFKYPFDDKTWSWLRHSQVEIVEELGVASAVNFLPFLRFTSGSAQNTIRMITKGLAQVHEVYAKIIEKRRKMLGLEIPTGAERKEHANLMSEHPEGFIKFVTYSKHTAEAESHYFDPSVLIPSNDTCILDHFLIEQKKRYQEGDQKAFYTNDEQLHFLLGDIFGASLDTTLITISWFFLFVALHPEVQDKIRNEILAIYPEGGDIDSAKLPYLMAAICETQRIRTIVPLGVPHGCLQDTYIGKYKIPKGTMVVAFLWAIFMDPNIWDEPEKYNPSRFIDEHGELLKPSEFIPFQTGKRVCPGDELSRMALASFTAYLLRSFKISLSSDPPTPEEMKGEVGITLGPPQVQYICEPIN